MGCRGGAFSAFNSELPPGACTVELRNVLRYLGSVVETVDSYMYLKGV